MDDIYHPTNCGDDCPICHPSVVKIYLASDRWRAWHSFPGWEFRAEKTRTGTILLARPKQRVTKSG